MSDRRAEAHQRQEVKLDHAWRLVAETDVAAVQQPRQGCMTPAKMNHESLALLPRLLVQFY